MPPVAIAVASAIAYAGVSGALAGTIGTLAASLVGALAATGVSFLGNLIFGPKTKTNHKETSRNAISTHKIIEGQIRVGGAVTFMQCSNNNDRLRLVVTVACHPSFEIDTLYFGETEVTLAWDDVNNRWFGVKPYQLPDGTKPVDFHQNSVQTPLVVYGLGTVVDDVDFNAFMATNLGDTPCQWTPECRQYTRTKIALEIFWSANKYGSTGIPPISAVLRGKKHYDSRNAGVHIIASLADSPGIIELSSPHGASAGDLVTILNHVASVPPIANQYEVNSIVSPTELTLLGPDSSPLTIITGGSGGTLQVLGWDNNGALAIADYCADDIYGPGMNMATEIDLSQLNTAANICDEAVLRALPQTTFTANPSTDFIQYDISQNSTAGDIPNYCQVMLSSTGVLPAPLQSNTVYYFAQSGTLPGPFGHLCTSLDNAKDHPPIYIDITNAGSGVHTLTVVSTFTGFQAGLTTDSSSGDVVSYANSLLLFSRALRITTGCAIKFSSSGGTLPSPLVAGTIYYAILQTDQRIQVASSLANARAGNPISLITPGTGTNLVQVVNEPRYMCDGVLDTAKTIKDNIDDLRTCIAGYVVPAGLTTGIYPGAYLIPAVSIDEGDLRGEIQFQSVMSGQEIFNATRGTFVDPFNAYEQTDFPSFIDSTYLAEDNDFLVFRDMQFPFSISSATCQRIAQIELNRSRRQGLLTLPCKYTAFQNVVPDVLMVDNAMWGFSADTFELQGWTFTTEMDGAGIPALVVDMTLKKTDANVFQWSTNNELGHRSQAITTLPNPFVVGAPSNLIVTSGDGTLYTRQDGTVFTRALLTWTPTTDEFVANGGHQEIQFKPTASSTWISSDPPLPGDANQAYVVDVQDGVRYDFAIRSRNVVGAVSDDSHPWQCEITNILIAGKSSAPSDIASLTVAANATVVTLAGSPIPDTDLAVYEYRYGATPDWNSSTILGTAAARPTAGGFAGVLNSGNCPAGTWWFSVKAVNTSGIYSVDAAFKQATITNQVSGSQVADGSISIAKFIAGITAVEIVTSLPVTGNFEGRTVVLTSDGQLYRFHSGSWTLAVPAVNVTGQLTAAQIASITAAQLTGQITTTQIANNSITTPLINSGAVNTAQLAAGSVVAANIATAAVTATALASGSVTTTALAASAVTAGKLGANSVTAGTIGVGAINASTLIVNDVIVQGHLQIGAANNASQTVVLTGTLGNTFADFGALSIFYNAGDRPPVWHCIACLGGDPSATVTIKAVFTGGVLGGKTVQQLWPSNVGSNVGTLFEATVMNYSNISETLSVDFSIKLASGTESIVGFAYMTQAIR